MKVKTLKDNVGTLNEKGSILDVNEEQANIWIKVGVVEVIKETPKKTTKKREVK